VLADLFARVNTVIEIGDERGNRPLKVDIVLPERVVGVNQKGLAGGSPELARAPKRR
jgi:hypothetical protein